MNSKKTIFLTGASGNMGSATVEHLLERTDRFQIKALVLPGERENPRVQRLLQHTGLEVIWGDLTQYEDVLAGLSGADYVLQVGAMVSP